MPSPASARRCTSVSGDAGTLPVGGKHKRVDSGKIGAKGQTVKTKNFLDRLISMVTKKQPADVPVDSDRAAGQVVFSPYTPKPITDPKHPALSVFPQNLLFRNRDSHRFHALYVPDPRTLLVGKVELKLTYHNIRDAQARTVITFDKKMNSWSAEKFFKQEYLGSAKGADWNGFFFQVGILGADVREKTGILDVQDVVRGGSFAGQHSGSIH